MIATQNPIEMEGTYPLPEAQRDRFGLRIDIGYPSPAAEVAMLEHHGDTDPLGPLAPVARAATVMEAIGIVRRVYVHPQVKQYLVNVVSATRAAPELRLGASPRASLQLMRAAKAWAAMDGRGYVIPEDIADLAIPTLAHRVLLSPAAQLAGRNPADAVAAAIATVAVPAKR